MHIEHPADYSPLSYGAAMTIGLLLILGLPAEPKLPRPRALPSPGHPATPCAKLAAVSALPLPEAQA